MVTQFSQPLIKTNKYFFLSTFLSYISINSINILSIGQAFKGKELRYLWMLSPLLDSNEHTFIHPATLAYKVFITFSKNFVLLQRPLATLTGLGREVVYCGVQNLPPPPPPDVVLSWLVLDLLLELKGEVTWKNNGFYYKLTYNVHE